MNSNNVFHLTQYVQNCIISTCNHSKNMNEIVYVLFLILSLKSAMYFTITALIPKLNFQTSKI